jgi:predicted metal-binding protein
VTEGAILAGGPASARAWIKVCTTCDRHATPPESIGAALADAVEVATAALRRTNSLDFLRVPCLSGCRNPGNVALGGTGRTKLRLHRLKVDDAGAVARLAELSLGSVGGEIPERIWPQTLRGRLATIIAPR